MIVQVVLNVIFVTILMTSESVTAIKTYVEIPESSEINGTTYVISSFSPKTFIKSAEFDLNATQCIQYTFRLMERRVRLHAYTCLISEGGFCTLDKFSFPDDREGCTYLRPWTHKVDSWSFYFILEKRPRKYGKAWHSRQNKTRRNVTKRTASTEPSGIMELYGIVPCSEACNDKKMDKIGSQSDGTFYRGRGNRLLH